jgi:hypothetical protein
MAVRATKSDEKRRRSEDSVYANKGFSTECPMALRATKSDEDVCWSGLSLQGRLQPLSGPGLKPRLQAKACSTKSVSNGVPDGPRATKSDEKRRHSEDSAYAQGVFNRAPHHCAGVSAFTPVVTR